MEPTTTRKTAIIFGYTGLIGSRLTKQLLSDSRYSTVKIFVRQAVSIDHPAVKVIVNDMNNIESMASDLIGDEVYCCLGTTSKKAGSKEAYERVDLHIPLEIAALAIKNKVGKYLIISSTGADSGSRNFYLRTKGRMEEGLKEFGFRQLSIFRPSLLLGERPEKRPLEDFGKILFRIFSFLFIGPLKKYKGINAEIVAKAMIRVANNVPAKTIYESDQIQKLGSETT